MSGLHSRPTHVRPVADTIDLINSLARDADTARKQFVADVSADRIRLTCEQRLVHLKKFCVENRSVGDNDFAGRQKQMVTKHNLAG